MPLTIPANPIPAHAMSAPLSRSKRGVAMPDKLWPQHSVLTISRLNMTQEQKDLVKHNINKWAPHTNLYFKFIDSPDGDIRITVDNDTGPGWSKLGIDAKTLPLSAPTMGISFTRSDASIAATIQHEFGHALGLKHEHQHPDRTLDLNRDYIYDEHEERGNSAMRPIRISSGLFPATWYRPLQTMMTNPSCTMAFLPQDSTVAPPSRVTSNCLKTIKRSCSRFIQKIKPSWANCSIQASGQ
ncbi:M12 family metallopeptidase [Pseudomonas orientalis]|uniref:M12 family metallopeptidase n=1 Tax=Pseudomonas orientalis TaxID=76758 RepID=UPI0034D77F1D